MSILTVRNLNTGYGKKQVLFDVSFDVEKGENVLLVGANGSGKSTLFKTLFQILPLWRSRKKTTIEFDNNDLTNLPTHKLVGTGLFYIPQKNQFFEKMNVFQNLEISILHLNNKKEGQNRLDEVFSFLPVLADLSKQQVNNLSGGQRKLLSLGMAIANKPKIIFFDEILAGIDSHNEQITIDIIRSFPSLGITSLLIEHRIRNIFTISDKVLGLKLGHLHNKPFTSIAEIKHFLL